MKTKKEYYDKLKERHPDSIILFRRGDFYEACCEDADTVARVLGIQIINEGDIHTAAFPHYALDTYLPKLIRSGLKVAIYDYDASSNKQSK